MKDLLSILYEEERVYGKDDHECAGTVGADGH
jgi:hypothetical protein